MGKPAAASTKVDVGGKDGLSEAEFVQLQALQAFLREREASWEDKLRRDPEAARKQLEQAGGASLLDTVKTGLGHGITHGFSDDMERAGVTPLGRKKVDEQYEKATGRKVAGDHVRAKASNPTAFAASQLVGTLATGVALRVGVPKAARGQAAKVRESGRLTAGGMRPGYEARARNLEDNIANYGIKSPRKRALAMDAAHGGFWGYGGVEVDEDEEAFSAERLARAGGGAAMSALAAPLATSAGAAATNIPLAFGKRRAFSRKMMEPPGVTKDNPDGLPTEAIQIARSRDESAARGMGEKSSISRDTARPIDSTRRNMQDLADAAIEPVAPEVIATARRRERGQAADAIEGAYADPLKDQPSALAPMPAGKPKQGDLFGDGPMLTNQEKTVVDAMERGKGWQDIAKFMGFSAEDMASGVAQRHVERLSSRAREKMDAAGAPTRPEGAAPGTGSFRNKVLGPVATRVKPTAATASAPAPAAPAAKDPAASYVNDMMEAFVRQDLGALGSWIGKVRAATKKDSRIMPAVQAAVARQLAMAERNGWVNARGQAINDAPETAAFLRVLGMGPSAKAGKAGVLADARGPARAANDASRYSDALKRREGKTPMRPRHAANMRRTMDTFEPGEYTGPAMSGRGAPLVARGDDKAEFLNPLDFYVGRKHVSDDAVQASALVSGPLAYGIEAGIAGPAASALFGGPEEQEPPIEARRVAPGVYDATPAQDRGQPQRTAPMQPQMQPQQPAAPVLKPRVGPTASMAPEPGELRPDRVVKDIQRLLIANGIDVGPYGDDGKLGPDTLAMIESFGISGGTEPSRMLARLKLYLAARQREGAQ